MTRHRLVIAYLAACGSTAACAGEPSYAPPPRAPTTTLELTGSPETAPAKLDLEALARLDSVPELAQHQDDPRLEARRIVAERIARLGGPYATAPLDKLAADHDPVTAAWALFGLHLLSTDAAKQALFTQLSRRPAEEHQPLIDAMARHVGGIGVLALLEWLPEDPKARFYRQIAVFKALDALNDPRAIDDLAKYQRHAAHPHFEFRAAAALARLGDLRAIPTLATRLRIDPLKLYSDEHEWDMMLKRDDSERTTCARLIAELAVMFPESQAELREQAEGPLLFWSHELPSPHANAMRALAALGSERGRDDLRRWANPQAPLPLPGAQPPMPEEWVIAQSALRYVGAMRDEPSFNVLVRALDARPAAINVSMDGLIRGGLAILGMSVRAIGVGAAQGLSEWGDPRGFQALSKHAAEVRNNEQSRLEACAALAWTLPTRNAKALLRMLIDAAKPGAHDEFRRDCALHALTQRRLVFDADPLVALLSPSTPADPRRAVARAGEGRVRCSSRAGIDRAEPRSSRSRAGAALGGQCRGQPSKLARGSSRAAEGAGGADRD